MKKLFTLLAAALTVSFASAQQILLITQTFDNGPTTFVFDSAGPGANTGSNDWVINNLYTGGYYPNTPNEDSVVLGQINGAPYSNYLHITDKVYAAATGNADDCWDTAVASDRFCYIGSPFCTLGLDSVIFTFFWICEGNTDAYGQVYYSANGGPWTQTGLPKYNNQSKWKYEVIADPAFQNVENLQLGFRWVNPSTVTDSADVAFGIDDIIAIGTYDSINNPVNITINYVSTPNCQGDYVTIGYTLSAPLCDGTYDIKLSNGNGSFTNATDEGIFNIAAPDTSGYIAIIAPTNVTGNCFKIRIDRVSPPPVIIGDTSICFAIDSCPNIIITDGAPVMTDVDTACILSVIDVQFNSYGIYTTGNTYIAQLSDSTGSFTNPFVLGTLPSTTTYNSFPPGNVSGLIPANVPPGCGYYIRVISTNPPAIGSLIGPFCLKHCDVTTDSTNSLHFCINYPNATDSAWLDINTNWWNDSTQYDTCNNFTIQLLDMMSFSIINTGGLGLYHDTATGRFLLIVGPLSSLPVAPGTYYMRIIGSGNCTNEPWDTTGTVIHITIGAPATSLTVVSTTGDSAFCNAGIMDLYPNPTNWPNSSYNWFSNLFGNGLAIAGQSPRGDFYGNLNGALVGQYKFYVQEDNFGCLGPLSAPYIYYITTLPHDTIHGPKIVCIGDTVLYNISFLPQTYYNWDAPSNVEILDEGNSQVRMIFDSLGDYRISCYSLNICGGDTQFYYVKVTTLFNVSAQPDTSICAGQPITLSVLSAPLSKIFVTDTTDNTPGKQGAMFNLIAHFDLTIDSFAVRYQETVPVQAAIYGKNGTYRGFEGFPADWTMIGSYNNFNPAPLGQMTVIPIDVNQTIANSDTFAFYITTTNDTPVLMSYGSGTGITQGVVYKTDSILDFVQGNIINYPFSTHLGPKVLDVKIYYSTKAGIKYSWSTGDTTSTVTVTPTQNMEYYVLVRDTGGCRNLDSVSIKVAAIPTVNAGPDTSLCPNVSYGIPGSSSSSSVLWQPGLGLSDSTIPNPTFNYNQSVSYLLIASSSDSMKCKAIDTLNILVRSGNVYAGPDTTICDGQTLTFDSASSSLPNVTWTPATGLSADNIINPVFNYGQSMIYVLSATDAFNCTYVDTVDITVDPCSLAVPNAFTPNGDGKNDIFLVFGNLSEYSIKIYNRWGEEVYSYTNDAVNSDLQDLGGWDGTYKGKMQDPGTFVYYISGKDAGGKNYFKKGNVTLIR